MKTMKRLKISDLFTPEYVFDGSDGIFHFIGAYDSGLTTPLLSGIIDANNDDALDNDYLVGFSSDKYISPYLQKAIEYACNSLGLDINQLYDGTMSLADRAALINDLFDNDGGSFYITSGLHERFASKWKHIWDALNTQYKPLDNYSMLEERTPDITKETTYDTTDERTPNITKTTNGTGNTTTDGETNIFGFNSTSGNPSSSMSGNQTDTITDRTETETGTDTTTKGGTITDTESGKETIERSGNIGVTSSQQMLEQEWQVRQHDFYEMIYRDIDSILCLKTY